MQLVIRVEEGRVAPQEGQTLYCEGLAGIYKVLVRKIIHTEKHPEDGADLVTVGAAQELFRSRYLEGGELDPTYEDPIN